MISAIVPCYNEAENILSFAVRLDRALWRLHEAYEMIFMVGGTDNTYSILHEWRRNRSNIWIIYDKDRGLGTAIKKGLSFVHRDSTRILTMDSDLQQLPEEIHKLTEQSGDCIIGGKRTDSRSFTKKLVSKMTNWFVGKVYHTGISDHSSNFRVYDREAIRAVQSQLVSKDYQIMPEILIRMKRAGYGRFAQVNVTFAKRAGGKSKMRMLHVAIGYIRLIYALSLSRVDE